MCQTLTGMYLLGKSYGIPLRRFALLSLNLVLILPRRRLLYFATWLASLSASVRLYVRSEMCSVIK